MKRKALFAILFVSILSCKKNYPIVEPPVDPVPPNTKTLLKDLVIPNLPSPYYHFEYDTAGQVDFVSFASDFFRYKVFYDGNRISELRNMIIVNKDRIEYFYNDGGRVNEILYADSTGLAYTRIRLAYLGDKLIKTQRERIMPAGTFVDRIMTMSYFADGNLAVLTSHYLPHDTQAEAFFIDRFEQYDDKINTDGFSLLHPEFFDHLFLLPGVTLQKNNPLKESRTGDGTNYTVSYTYAYDNKMRPLTKTGDLTFTNGADSGTHHEVSEILSYY